MTDQDEALIPALRRFQDAVSALIDPQRQILDGKILYLDSLYSQLSDSLAGQQGHAANRYPRSMPILWLDAHDCLAAIDALVAKWDAVGDTVERLQVLSERKYRPQDTRLLTDRAGELEACAKTIKTLLLPDIVIHLYGHRCPICGQSHVRRKDATGAAMTQPTLMIRGDSALCQECKAVWEYSRLPMLGRMLGVQPTAIVGGEGS